MTNCPACQAQMLEYLYDLLDETERQDMQTHLDGCAACRAELARTKGQQQLLAAAARMEFPDVRFAAPTGPAPKAETPARAPAVIPLPQPAKRQTRPWRRWAAAAAILLALAGVSIPGYWMNRDYADAVRIAAEKRNASVAAQESMKNVLERIQKLPSEEHKLIEEVRSAERAHQFKLAVVGPATIAAGAPTAYEIQTKDLNDAFVPATVTARVVGADKQPIGPPIPVVHAEVGKYTIVLPADLPVKPEARPVLVVSAKADAGVLASVTEALDLSAPVYITHLETDKPMYQPGEIVYFRSLTLDRFSLKPAEEDLRLTYELVTPTSGKKPILQGADGLRNRLGEPVLGPDGKPLHGIGVGEVALDPRLDGGEYTLVCREENNRFPEQHRKFMVNSYAKPQLNKQLDFSRSTYGPGDEVSASCKATLANGDPVRNQPVEATVLIDDKKYGADGKETQQPVRFHTDDQGKVDVRFHLPQSIERGEASLGVKFLGNPVETITRPLPIVLKKLNVEFYPEGGDLAADLPNRVYFQVRTTLGKPADIEGRLFEDGQPLSVAVKTLRDAQEPGVNQGMGRFELTPKSGKKYELQIDSPVGITQRVALPDVKQDGVELSVPEGVAEAGKPIKAIVRSKTERDLMVGLYCRGRLLQSVQLKKGETEAVLNPESGVGGVCRVTVFEEQPAVGNRRELKPVAERLIYRRPAEFLTVNLQTDKSSYVPGDRAKVNIETRNEKEELVPAVVMLAVVDKSILTLADEKNYRSGPAHFLLTSEVRKPEDLEYADFLLGPQAKATEALDLLLGVQGWRRFAEQDPANFRKRNTDKEEADRLLVMTGQSTPRRTDLVEDQIKTIRQETDAKVARLKEQYEKADVESKALFTDPSFKAASEKTASYNRLIEQVRVIGTPLVGTALLVAALACLVMGLRNANRRAVPWYAAATACAVLLIVAVQWYRTGGPPMEPGAVQVAHMTPGAMNAPAPPDMGQRLEPDAKEWADVALDDRNEGLQEVPEAASAPAGLAKGNVPQPATAPAPGSFLPPMAAPAAPTDKPGLGGGIPPANADKAGETKFGVAFALQQNQRGQGAQDRNLLEKQAFGLKREEAENKGKDAFAQKKTDEAVLREQFKDEGNARKELNDGDRDEARRALLWQRNREQLDRLRAAADGKTALAARTPAQNMVVREYAHEREAGATPELRSDFAETLTWRPVLVLPDGRADVTFDLCDSATTFQAAAFAHTLDGRLGAGVKILESRLPFTLQPATPLEVTASDKIDVPLSVANNTTERRDVQLALKTHTNLNLLSGDETARLAVNAGKTARPLYRFQPTIKEGDAVLEFAGKTDPFAADAVRAKFHIVPEGFPAAESRSDVLENSASQTVTLPETWVKGTLKCQVQVYPSTLADLQKGLDSLLREPNGCFEQTSTSNYPNLLILNYLKESDQTKPEVERRARELLSRGYQKLTSFECMNTATNARQGYEWFGGTAPAHEALTAYGLLQFRDMARVQEVDPVMMKRTQDYLMSRRDGKGGFQRNPRAIDSFGRAPDDVTNAYIVWALTESGKDDDLTKELNALAEQGKTSKDPYFLSLVANSLINRARTEEGVELLKTVAGAQKEDGHLDAEKTSITGSGGRDLQIETTGLAVLGWLKANPGTFNGALQKAVTWIGKQRGGYGGFGSTQSTILALKALIAYTKANKRTVEGGELKLFVGDKEAGKLPFAAGASDALTLEMKDAETVLHPGRNDVRIEITGKNVFPYTLAWTYQTLKPVAADDCPVRLTTKLSQTDVQEGDLVRLNMTLENVSGKGQSMATAILGLPGGLIVPEDMKQLKQYCREPEDGSRPLVSAFEIRGRELVLYWRDLAPGQKINVPLDLIARTPGEYSGPASRGYLYYNADHKHWVDPLRVVIAAKVE